MPPDDTLAPPPAPSARSLTCPSCGGSVALRAAGYTVNVACVYCGSILDVADPQVKLVTEYNVIASRLEIPLGTRGILDGVEWEAIGYLQRSENGYYGWEEYLLFNPYHGYRWLVNIRGGWSLGEMLTVTPDWWTFDTMALDGQSFTRFFEDGRARVDDVLGEFYWRVSIGETVTTSDWVRPGAMLSREENGNEISWTLNRWLPPRVVEKAFEVLPAWSVWPPLPHQPSPYGAWLKSGFKIGGLALAVLVAMAFIFGGTTSSTAGTFPIAGDGREQSVTLGPVVLPRPYQRVRIVADVPMLENGWVDLDYTLVDRRTQQVYDGYGAAERYSGRDSDGAWTEGSRGSDVSIASVPAGTYDLVVDYKANNWSGSSFPGEIGRGWMNSGGFPQITVEVRYGVVFASNFLIALALVALPLIFAIWRHLKFEKARKEESDFAVGTDE
jgi:hypothetical protein